MKANYPILMLCIAIITHSSLSIPSPQNAPSPSFYPLSQTPTTNLSPQSHSPAKNHKTTAHHQAHHTRNPTPIAQRASINADTASKANCTTDLPAKQIINNRYPYPLSKSFSSNPLSLTAFSIGACYASFLYWLCTQKGKSAVLLSAATALGSGLYAEYIYRKALYAIPIQQISVRQQADTTCVVHALANALTLHELLLLSEKNAEKVSFNVLDSISDIHYKLDNTNYYDQIYKTIVTDLNIDPVLGLACPTTAYLIKFFGYTESIFQIKYSQIGDTTNSEFKRLKKQIELLKNQKIGALHIKCTISYPLDATPHAVIISLIKQNGTLSMIYMDSNNTSLRCCPQAVEHIRFIYDYLLPH